MWVDQKRRQVLYQRYIRATQVLYQLPIKTSGEDGCIATNEAIKNFSGGYYRVDDINYLCHVRYGMFPCNKSLALGRCAPSCLVIYCRNIPNGRDITNTYYTSVSNIYAHKPIQQINEGIICM